jgi:hypothetical protein
VDASASALHSTAVCLRLAGADKVADDNRRLSPHVVAQQRAPHDTAAAKFFHVNAADILWCSRTATIKETKWDSSVAPGRLGCKGKGACLFQQLDHFLIS